MQTYKKSIYFYVLMETTFVCLIVLFYSSDIKQLDIFRKILLRELKIEIFRIELCSFSMAQEKHDKYNFLFYM